MRFPSLPPGGLLAYNAVMPIPQQFPHGGASLAYRFTPGAGPLILFLPGFMSDLTGSKAVAVADWARGHGQACLRLDYSGCGASSGDFLDGSIGRWTGDVLALIDHLWPSGQVLLVGSSMGGWIGLLAGMRLKTRLAGLVGIAAAPDFTRWGLKITDLDREHLETNGYFTRPSDYGAPYRYSRALIADAPDHLLMDGLIPIDAPVRLLHGQCDDAVPWRLALDIAARITGEDVQVRLIKDGDHRLSREADIAALVGMIKELV